MHLSVRGNRLEYRFVEADDAAARDRNVIVLLHEGLGSVAMWKDFPDALANVTGHPVLAFSRYGYGRSTRLKQPRRVGYMHDEAVHALPDLLSQLDIRDPLLVGHSDGASIAIIHAGSGFSVAGLVLMAPHVFVEQISIDAITDAKRAFQTSDLSRKLARYHDHPDSMFRGWNDIWLHPMFREWNIEPYLSDIHAPVVLIQGDDDPYGTLVHVESIEQRAGGPVEKHIFADCGHAPHVERKQQTLDAIREFVNELDTA